MSEKSAKIQKKRYATIRVELWAYIEKAEEGGYVSCCPPLGVYSQGETIKEARENIIEASQLFVESCVEREVLEKVLMKRNYFQKIRKSAKAGNAKVRRKRITPPPGRVVEFPAELPILAY